MTVLSIEEANQGEKRDDDKKYSTEVVARDQIMEDAINKQVVAV